jgi:hypothetical protein
MVFVRRPRGILKTGLLTKFVCRRPKRPSKLLWDETRLSRTERGSPVWPSKLLWERRDSHEQNGDLRFGLQNYYGKDETLTNRTVISGLAFKTIMGKTRLSRTERCSPVCSTTPTRGFGTRLWSSVQPICPSGLGLVCVRLVWDSSVVVGTAHLSV